MVIEFFKYQATGNDFVIIDNRDRKVALSIDHVRRICDRKFGVGADGLMLIEPHQSLDFHLQYYNSDGSESLCGNGSRAAVAFASVLGMLKKSTSFDAYDGPHQAELMNDGVIRLRMNDVNDIRKIDQDYFVHTGSPHYIRFVTAVMDYPVFEEGRRIRYSDQFKPGGTNVNFVELMGDNTIFVRTYERGVENETLSCGTGVTAAAIASSFAGLTSPVRIKTLGGELSVDFQSGRSGSSSGQAGTFTDVFLSGPAKMVFKGQLEL